MTNPIRGKVARVLNSREIAINVGLEKGVHVGMHFDVLDPKYENIKDPDTNELLGSVERPKVRVQIIRVQEKLSIASTYRKKKINVGGNSFIMGSFSEFLMPPDWKTEYETLKTQEQDWEDIEARESYVKVGDPVAQVILPDMRKEDEKMQLGAVS